jgi:hypothetical protein
MPKRGRRGEGVVLSIVDEGRAALAPGLLLDDGPASP